MVWPNAVTKKTWPSSDFFGPNAVLAKGGHAENNIVRNSVKASPAEGWRRFHRNTAYARLFGFQQAFMPAEGRGLLKVQRFRCSGKLVFDEIGF